jgi:hypothetical protein
MKLDDSSWHVHDSGETIAVHIALVFCWLVEDGFIEPDVLKSWNLSKTINRGRKPSEYLQHYSDGKLFTVYIQNKYRDKISDIYQDKYLTDVSDVQIMGLDRQGTNFPYNIKDTWRNVDIVRAYFESQLAAMW